MTRVSRLSPSAFLLLLLLPPLGCGGASRGPGSGIDVPSLDDDDTSPTEDDDDSASGGDDDDTTAAGDDDDTTPTGDDDDSGPAERVVVAPDYLNLRAGPSSNAAVLRGLPCGSPVDVLGEESGGLPWPGCGGGSTSSRRAPPPMWATPPGCGSSTRRSWCSPHGDDPVARQAHGAVPRDPGACGPAARAGGAPTERRLLPSATPRDDADAEPRA